MNADMDPSPEASAVRIDTLESRTFLNSICHKAANFRLHPEMPSRLWSEWNGPSMLSSAMVAHLPSWIEFLAHSVSTPPPSKSSVSMKALS